MTESPLSNESRMHTTVLVFLFRRFPLVIYAESLRRRCPRIMWGECQTIRRLAPLHFRVYALITATTDRRSVLPLNNCDPEVTAN